MNHVTSGIVGCDPYDAGDSNSDMAANAVAYSVAA
jgi:hypothetical protein